MTHHEVLLIAFRLGNAASTKAHKAAIERGCGDKEAEALALQAYDRASNAVFDAMKDVLQPA